MGVAPKRGRSKTRTETGNSPAKPAAGSELSVKPENRTDPEHLFSRLKSLPNKWRDDKPPDQCHLCERLLGPSAPIHETQTGKLLCAKCVEKLMNEWLNPTNES